MGLQRAHFLCGVVLCKGAGSRILSSLTINLDSYEVEPIMAVAVMHRGAAHDPYCL